MFLVALGNAKQHLVAVEADALGHVAVGAEVDLVFVGRLEILALVEEHQRHGQLRTGLEDLLLDLFDRILVGSDRGLGTAFFLHQFGGADIAILHQHWLGGVLRGQQRVGGQSFFDVAGLGVNITLLEMGLGHQLARGFLDHALELERGHLDDFLLGHLREVVAGDQAVEVIERVVVALKLVVALGDLE